MKLTDFPLFADENVFRVLVNYLHNFGFDVLSVQDLNLQGTSDIEVLTLATNEERIVLTQDNDFGKIVFTRQTDFIGIIYLRPGHFPPAKHITSLEAVLQNNPEVVPPFILTVEQRSDQTFRIRVRNNIYG